MDSRPAERIHRVGAVATNARIRASLVVLGLVTIALPGAASGQVEEDIGGRIEYERLRFYSGPNVNIAELLLTARRQVLAMGTGGVVPSMAEGMRWRPLGPDRVEEEGWVRAGRVSGIAIHPRNPDILYVGGAQGGVWRSNNAGASWNPLTDNECSVAMGSIVIDPVNPDIVYAGTGDPVGQYGCGVLRSLNGGATWEQLGAEVFVRKNEWLAGAQISRLVIDPVTAGSAGSTTVLAATQIGVFRSTDSGRTWTLVLRGVATDLAMRPGDPSVLYAATRSTNWWELPATADDYGIFRSTDGGRTWISASEGLPDTGVARIGLAIAPSAPDVMYVALERFGAEEGGPFLFRTNDGAATWRPAPAAGTDRSAAAGGAWGWGIVLVVHPLDATRLYFGNSTLHVSEDGGDSFRFPAGDYWGNYRNIYVDQHFLVFDTLTGPDALYLANDGGVYRSTDGGDSWSSLATNLAVSQFYPGISLHPSDPGVTLGGTQDQGVLRSAPGTKAWVKVVGGDGGFTAFDAEDPEIWYAECQWACGGPLKNGELANSGIDVSEDALFLPPIVMDPVDSRRLYFGTQSLYRTDDAAESWTRLYRHEFEEVISAIAPSAADPNTVYAGIWGRVLVTRDGGETWLETGGALPWRHLTDLAAHPDDPEQAYAVFGGFLTGHVFRTMDGGRSWRDVSGNLPDLPVNAVLYDPADVNGVYVGTALGVFHSARGGGSWTRLADGMPMIEVLDLAAQPGTGRLVAATYGRGMFEIPIRVPLSARVRPGALVDTVLAADDGIVAGEVIVAPRGRDDYMAAWAATVGDAPWITLTDATGQGRGRFGYSVTGTGLLPGDHEAEVTVTVAGLEEPLSIAANVHALPWSSVALDRTGGRKSVPRGHDGLVKDSVRVTFTGPLAERTEWTASHGGREWLQLTRTSGTGDGAVRWDIDPGGLEEGIYVDTVLVTAELAAGSPAMFVDTLSVETPLRVAELRGTSGLGIAGWSILAGDSIAAGLTGFGADAAVWTAESRSDWLVIERRAGGVSEPIVWSRSAESLAPGIYEDSITVRVVNHPDVKGLIVDRFEVVEPIGVDAAAHHLLGSGQLVPAQTRLLDWFGNGDGVFNAGDVLRWLDHCASGIAASGCAARPAPPLVGGPRIPPGRQP